MASGSDTIKNHAAFIWSVADLRRGDYKRSGYGKVVLPLTVLRRFDCVLDPVKQDMLDMYGRVQGKVENFGPMLDQLTAVKGLWNTSTYDVAKLLGDPDNIRINLLDYIASGRLVRQADCYLLTEDTLFRAQSAATLVLTGAHINGRIEWSHVDGTTLKAHQIRRAEGTPA